MMIGLLGAAWSYATTAYTYNQGRFQFDAGQKQTSAHMRMNLRLAQWNLFREDVRDLFNLTTTNMSTYMVVGTLFLGFSISLIYCTLKDYPLKPGWLLLIYGNILFASLAFGILAVWLAMHGTVAAHSASVKVLTQFIRPPIPTAIDTEKVRFTLSRYEGGGGLNMLRPPDMLGTGALDTAPASTPVTAGAVAPGRPVSFAMEDEQRLRGSNEQLPRRSSGGQFAVRSIQDEQKPQVSGGTSSKGRSSMHERSHTHETASSIHEEDEYDEARAQLADAEGVGPGRSAEMDAHVELFRQLQLQYACFDAYARAALSAAANQVLLVLAYFVIGHCMVKDGEDKRPISIRPLVWCSVIVCCVAARTLFKLDLYVDKRSLRFVKEAFVAGPIVSCLAAHLWTDIRLNHRYGEVAWNVPEPFINLLALFASVLHTIWMGIQVRQARPGPGPGSLPIAFRSVQYLDVFGWQDQLKQEEDDIEDAAMELSHMSEEALEAHDEAILQRVVRKRAMRQSKRLLAKVQQLRAVSMKDHISNEDTKKLACMEEDLLTISKDMQLQDSEKGKRISADSDPQLDSFGKDQLWIRTAMTADSGQDLEYFLNAATGEVKWEEPKAGQVMNLKELGSTVDHLRRSVKGSELEDASNTLRRRVNFDIPESHTPMTVEMQERIRRSSHHSGNEDWETRSARSEEHTSETRSRGAGTHEIRAFQPMMRRPGSSHTLSSMPWKYFSHIGYMLFTIWIFTVAYIFWEYVLMEDYFSPFSPIDPMDFSDKLSVEWPETYFRPTGVACTGSSLVISDSLSFYQAEAADDKDVRPSLLRGIVTLGRQTPWRSIALLCEESGDNCTHVLALDNAGANVTQHSLNGDKNGEEASTYQLSSRLGAKVDAIDIIVGERVTKVCENVRSVKDLSYKENWALNAITATWDVIQLCPVYEKLPGSKKAVNAILQPVRILSSLPETVTGARGRILGMQVRKDGHIWVSARNSLVSRTELQLWSKKGDLLDSWHLPYGRTWAPGFCDRGVGDFIFAGAENVTNAAAHPEIWHLKAETHLKPEANTMSAMAESLHVAV